MPELKVEIGGRAFEVACDPGQEPSLARAARLLDAEARRVNDAIGLSTEKRMLLLAGLMLADSMSALEDRLKATEERLGATEERLRLTEAKAAMLAANALKLETESNHRIPLSEIERLQKEHAGAVALLQGVLDEVSTMAEELENGSPARA